MRSALAGAALFISLVMSHARAAASGQAPEGIPAQPAQTTPQTSQPIGTPEAQEPAPQNPEKDTKLNTEAPAAQESKPEEQTPAAAQESKPEPPTSHRQVSPHSSDKPASKTGNSKTTNSKKSKKKHKPAQAQRPDPPASTPTKKVVANGGTSETEIQISPRMSDKQQAVERQKIFDLLSAAEWNLQKASGRSLKDSEEEMAKQIRMYMEQAKIASQAGDLQRAQNLASKANLLSVELVGK
jgi:hypothetical protein